MKCSGHVDHGLRNRRLHFGDVTHSGEVFTLDLPTINAKDFDHNLTYLLCNLLLLQPIDKYTYISAYTILVALVNLYIFLS